MSRLAALTPVGAFGALCFSRFPLFEQLGLFTALGISLSFLFVHTVFPLIFPAMPPVGRLSRTRAWWVEHLKYKMSGNKCYYLSFDAIAAIILAAGYNIERSLPSGTKGDLVWIEVKTG